MTLKLFAIGVLLMALPRAGDMLRSAVDFLARLIAHGLILAAVTLLIYFLYSQGRLA